MTLSSLMHQTRFLRFLHGFFTVSSKAPKKPKAPKAPGMPVNSLTGGALSSRCQFPARKTSGTESQGDTRSDLYPLSSRPPAASGTHTYKGLR